MPANFLRNQNRAFVAIAVACLSMTAASIFLISQLVSANWWVGNTTKVIREGQEALISLSESDRLARAYLLTGDTRYQKMFEFSAIQAPAHIQKVGQLTKGNQGHQGLVQAISSLAGERIQLDREIVEQKEKDAGFNTLPHSSRDKALANFNQLQQRLDALLAEEQQQLEERERDVSFKTVAAGLFLFLLTATIVLNLLWTAKHAKQHMQAEEQIKEQLIAAKNEAIMATAAKARFVASVSHELRTPISSIIGLSEILATSDLEDENRELAEHIHSSGKSLLLLLTDLLDFSRIESGKLRLKVDPFYVTEVIDIAAHSLMVALANKSLDFEEHIEEPLKEIQFIGDPDRIRQILLNMMQNAVKYSEKGTVSVSATISGQADKKKMVRFQVADNGIGIPSEHLDSVFEAYTQIDATGKTRKLEGVGLGLSICQELVDLMGGTIGVESVQHKGSTFWFEIPLAIAEVTEPALEPVAQQ